MKKFSKILAFALAMMMTITMIAPITAKADEVGTVKPQIVGHTNKVTLAKGDKVVVMKAPVTLKASGVTYTSSNPKVVRVTKSANGIYYAYALKTGTATITAKSTTAGVASGTLKVTVVKAGTRAKSIALQPNDVTLYVGQKVKSKVITNPNTASKKMVYSSSNENVATVSSNGLITGKAGGTATITAHATDGSNKKSSVKITVTQIKWTGVNKIMTVGDSVEPSVYINFIPQTAAQNAEYISADSNIIRIEDGKLVAVGAGKTTVQVKAHDKSGVSKVYQFAVNSTVTGIEANDIEVGVGKTANIEATVVPENVENQGLTYEVTDGTAYIDVDGTGVVTGKAKGTATVTITSLANPEVTKQIKVTVKDVYTKATLKSTIEAGQPVEVKFREFTWSNDADFVNRLTEFLAKNKAVFDNIICTFVRNGQKYTATIDNGLVISDEAGNPVNLQEFLAKGEMKASDITVTFTANSLKKLVSWMETAQNLGSSLEYNGFIMSQVNYLGYNIAFGTTSKATIVYQTTGERCDYEFFVQDGAFYFHGDVTKTPLMANKLGVDFFDLSVVEM